MLNQNKTDALLELLRSFDSCAVAFSGGVDSAVVAKAAQLALGDHAVAVTGASASLAEGELDAAREIAAQIGIRHEILSTGEFNDPNYTANPSNRCYFCKTELYDQLEPLAKRLELAVIVNGANVDDAGDWRPGMQAAGEHQVRSPLLECGFTKADVRALAAPVELADLGQARFPLLIESCCLRRRSHAPASADDRPRRTIIALSRFANRARPISPRRSGTAGSAHRRHRAVGSTRNSRAIIQRTKTPRLQVRDARSGRLSFR